MKATKKATPEALSTLYKGIKALVEQRGEVEQDLCAQRQAAWDVHHVALIRMAEGTATVDDVTIVNLIREADAETGKTVTSASSEAGVTFKQLFSTDKAGNWRCKPSIVGKACTIQSVKELRNPWIAYDTQKPEKTTIEKAAAALTAASKIGGKYEGLFSGTALFNLECALAALQSELAAAQQQNAIGAAEPPSAAVASLPTPAEKAA